MRIAIVMPRGSAMRRDQPNSMETVARTLFEHSRFRAETTFVCDAGDDQPADVPIATVPAGLEKTRHARAVATVLRRLNPEIVEYHQQLETAALVARMMPGRVHVLYRHTRIKPPRHWLDRLRYGYRLAAFDHLIFVSEAARTEFCEDYPACATKAATICNPIDAKAWRQSPENREPIIMFCGRAMAEKGFEPFCLALARILDLEPGWRGAVLLGEWEQHRRWAEPHLLALGRFGDRVDIHRSASPTTVIDVTRRAAIAVTPSFVAEAMGLTALEAHAAGAALISSGRGGLREASGEHAVYVDPPDASGLVAAISALIADPGRRKTLARNGQEWVEANHSPVIRTAQLDDLRTALDTAARARTNGPR